MEIEVTNLRAEKAKDGRIIVYFSDGRLSEYKLVVAEIKGEDTIKWEADGVIRRGLI